MTGGSTCPKSTPSSARLNSSTRTINATEMAETMYTSWLAERLAWSRCPAPMDWAQTTAPPVARAAKMLMMSTLIRSTKCHGGYRRLTGGGDHHDIGHSHHDGQKLLDDQGDNQFFQGLVVKQKRNHPLKKGLLTTPFG